MLTIIFRLVLITSVLCDNADELLSVVIIYRHGDRTPVQPYPTDPYKNSSYWPVGWGQLTNLGKERQYQLGQWLRSRYASFLPLKYSEKDIYVRSTDVDRTLMSAEANLAGLYPPSDNQIWQSGMPWQPIPVHTIPELQDNVLSMKKPCFKYDLLKKKLLNSQYFVNITHRNHDLYAYLTRYTGTLVNDLEHMEYIYNTLFIEDSNNLTLPEWAKKVYPDKMKPWAALSFAVDTFTPGMARLKTGLLFNEIITHFRNTTQKFDTRKFFVYSGHDMTIAAVLNSMGVFEYHSPPYASTIMFELRKTNTSKHYVNLFYKNSSDLQILKLKSCDFNCDFDDFVKILEPIVMTPKQWEKECHSNWFLHIFFNSVSLLVVTSITLSLLIISIIFVSFKCSKFMRKHETNIYMQLPNDEVA